MKKIFLLIGLFSILLSYSQDTKIISGTRASTIYDGVRVGNGTWVKSKPIESKVVGTNHLYSNWLNNGSFYTTDKKAYKISNVNFNIKYNRFEANLSDTSKDSIFAFNSKSIEKVVIGEQEFIRKKVEGKGSNYFLELIQEGDKLSIFKSYTTVLVSGNINPMTQQKLSDDRITIKYSYYLDNNGKLEEVKLKKSTILKIMDDKKNELKSFLSKNKLSFKEEDDIKKIFVYYNSI